MVHLNRIYTKTGDDGTTGLGDGARVTKDDIRVDAYGMVDELNATIGLLIAHGGRRLLERDLLVSIANDLFDVGADLCLPLKPDEKPGAALRITENYAKRIEAAIDRLNRDLKPLTSFVLPGGAPAAAWCHLARTVCRRAERRVVTLGRHNPLNPHVLKYLNRLSDLLFVLCRVYNNGGRDDVLWKPGGGNSAPS